MLDCIKIYYLKIAMRTSLVTLIRSFFTYCIMKTTLCIGVLFLLETEMFLVYLFKLALNKYWWSFFHRNKLRK